MPSRPRTAFAGVAVVAAWSAWQPADVAVWWMEALPAVVGLPLVWLLWQRFPWTRLAAWAMALHAVVLLVGAHYTYAETPLGFWLQDAFDFSRNHYDRIGHLAQGFIPAMVAREKPVKQRGARTTDMKESGGRRGKARDHCASLCAAFACHKSLFPFQYLDGHISHVCCACRRWRRQRQCCIAAPLAHGTGLVQHGRNNR